MHYFRYAIVVEETENNYSAYVPDLPGCVATGHTVEETEREMREAIALHIEGLREDGLPIPQAVSIVEYLEVAAEALKSMLVGCLAPVNKNRTETH